MKHEKRAPNRLKTPKWVGFQVKLKNRRVRAGRYANGEWAVEFVRLDPLTRKPAVAVLWLTDEAMQALVHLYYYIRRDCA